MSTVNSQCKMKQRKVNWWERRNNLEKILIVIIVFLLCFVFSLFIVLLLHFNRAFEYDTDILSPCFASQNIKTSKYENFKAAGACTTPSCIKAAAEIMDFVNVSVNPCDNFYDFTCSNFRSRWEETNKLAGLRTVEVVTENRIKKLIIGPVDHELPKPLELQRKFYETCMNTTAIDENRHDALLTLIGKVGGWPVRQGRFWYSENFNWLRFTIKCRKLGIEFNNLFLNITKQQISINGTEKMILLITPPIRDTIPPDLKDEYIDLMTNISLELDAIDDNNYARTELTRVINFEGELRQIHFDEDQNVITVETLRSRFPTIPWIDFLKNISTASVENDSLIDFRVSKYLFYLSDLLRRTPKTIQANYVIWKIVENYRNYLSEPLQHRYNMFLMKIYPEKALVDREAFCLSKAKLYFPSVAEAAYLRGYVKNHTRIQVNEVIDTIKEQTKSEIEATNQLDKTSKTILLTKLTATSERLKAYEKMYSENFDKVVGMENFDLNTDNIVEMDSQLNTIRMDAYFKNINKNNNEITQQSEDRSSILPVNPLDKASYKNLVFQSLLLNEILLHFESPNYVNYAALGSEIADEFNKLLPHKIDLAYKAYKHWVRLHFQEKTLPGLPYTQDQLFWITFGISKCYQLERKSTTASIINDTQNSEYFAAVFNCPKTP